MRNYTLVIFIIFIQCLAKVKANDRVPVYAKPTNTYRLGKTNLFNQLYMESGVKFSTQVDTVGNISYSQIALQHQLSSKWLLFHAYNYLTQNVRWGNINQQGYYVNLEYKKNTNLKFNIVTAYLHNRTKLNPTPAQPIVEFVSDDNIFYLLSSTIKFKHWFVKPVFAFSQLNNQGVKQDQFQMGGDLLYDVKDNEALVFGLGIYHFINNSLYSTFVKPSISYIINDELLISADYFYTNARNYSDQNGYIIYNSVDKTIDRSNVSLRYEFANNLFLYTIYQFERKQDYFTNNYYNFNSIFLGIKYNQ